MHDILPSMYDIRFLQFNHVHHLKFAAVEQTTRSIVRSHLQHLCPDLACIWPETRNHTFRCIRLAGCLTKLFSIGTNIATELEKFLTPPKKQTYLFSIY